MIEIMDLSREVRGSSRWTRFVLSLAILLLSGCGEAESPHFVPATGDTSSAERETGEKATREAPIPKNIPMH